MTKDQAGDDESVEWGDWPFIRIVRHAGLDPASIGPVSLWTPGQARGDEDIWSDVTIKSIHEICGHNSIHDAQEIINFFLFNLRNLRNLPKFAFKQLPLNLSNER